MFVTDEGKEWNIPYRTNRGELELEIREKPSIRWKTNHAEHPTSLTDIELVSITNHLINKYWDGPRRSTSGAKARFESGHLRHG
jgi:hypothetical protein